MMLLPRTSIYVPDLEQSGKVHDNIESQGVLMSAVVDLLVKIEVFLH